MLPCAYHPLPTKSSMYEDDSITYFSCLPALNSQKTCINGKVKIMVQFCLQLVKRNRIDFLWLRMPGMEMDCNLSFQVFPMLIEKSLDIFFSYQF